MKIGARTRVSIVTRQVIEVFLLLVCAVVTSSLVDVLRDLLEILGCPVCGKAGSQTMDSRSVRTVSPPSVDRPRVNSLVVSVELIPRNVDPSSLSSWRISTTEPAV